MRHFSHIALQLAEGGCGGRPYYHTRRLGPCMRTREAPGAANGPTRPIDKETPQSEIQSRIVHMHIAMYICISVYLSHICRNAHLHTRNVPPKRSNTRPPLQDGKSQTPQKHQNGGDGHLRRFSQCTSSSPKPRKSLLAHTKHTTFNFFSNLV